VKVALYSRVSTPDQAERWSLPAQRRILIEFADRQHWDYQVYEDAGISGETLDARPAILKLLDDARHGRIGVAVAVEMERFSRSESLFDWLVIKQAFREGKVRFGTPAQIYDPADTEDDFLTDLFGALAKREKRKIIERTRRGRLEAARKGKFVGALVPIGYRRIGEAALEVDSQGARVVRAIFTLAARGLSTRAISRTLLQRGIPSPRGFRVWNWSTVNRILRNATYIGQWRYNVTGPAAGDGGAKRLRRKPPDEWITVSVPPLLSPELFRRVQDQLERNTKWSPRRQKAAYLLKGVLRCGTCGLAMVGMGSRPNRRERVYRYYRCNRSNGTVPGRQRCPARPIRVDLLDEAVWSQVTAALRNPRSIIAAAQRYRESHVGQRDELLMRLEAVRDGLARLPEERERTQTLYREGAASLEETKTHLGQIERKRTALLEERDELEARLAMQTADEAQADRLHRLVREVAHKLDTLSAMKRAEVVRAFVRWVIVKPGPELEVHAFVPALQSGKLPRYVGALWAQALPSR
jgi:site-specific DNA recombinase